MRLTEAIAGRRMRMSALAAIAWICGAATTPAMAIPVARPPLSRALGVVGPATELIPGARAD